jgi:hypothetical protein
MGPGGIRRRDLRQVLFLSVPAAIPPCVSARSPQLRARRGKGGLPVPACVQHGPAWPAWPNMCFGTRERNNTHSRHRNARAAASKGHSLVVSMELGRLLWLGLEGA